MNRLKTSAQLLALFVFCFGLHACGTWILPLVDRDEPRFAEAAREMRERGDWILPTFNNEPRYDKPPLTYWLQIASYKVFGENEFAARFHSPLCAALTALVVFGFCARIFDRRAAWCAALAFTLCLQMFVNARAATADMPMILFVTLAAWAGWELCEMRNAECGMRNGEMWRAVFFGALAFGFLAKGPVAFLPVVWVVVHAKFARVPNLARRFCFARGSCVTLAIIAVWAVPALLKTHGEFFKIGIGRHVIERSFAPLEGHGGRGALMYFALLPFYFFTVFASFFPWSFWLPKTLQQIRQWRANPHGYLLGGILITFGIFSLIATKLPHYTLPVFPLLACLVAPELAKNHTRFCVIATGICVVEISMALLAFPALAQQLPVKTLVQKITPWTNRDAEIATADFFEPSLVWYLRGYFSKFPQTISRDEFSSWLVLPGERLCIWAGEGNALLLATTEGWNPATGKKIELNAALSISETQK